MAGRRPPSLTGLQCQCEKRSGNVGKSEDGREARKIIDQRGVTLPASG